VWLDILRNTTDQNTILLLLENPTDSQENIFQFVENYNPALIDRISFLDFIGNPYDNQRRVGAICDALLDTPNYNSHTTAVDALWGGVPLVTLGNCDVMAGRVTTSILSTLNVTELIAADESHYLKIAVELAQNRSWHRKVRSKIVNTCLNEVNRNPFWDMKRYARNLENGFEQVWSTFLEGKERRHVDVVDQVHDHALNSKKAWMWNENNGTDTLHLEYDDSGSVRNVDGSVDASPAMDSVAAAALASDHGDSDTGLGGTILVDFEVPTWLNNLDINFSGRSKRRGTRSKRLAAGRPENARK